MESLNVLVLAPAFDKSGYHADKESLRLIQAVSPAIKVKDGVSLADAESHGDYSNKPELDALLAWADVMFGIDAPTDTVSRAPKLKWIQAITAGVDHWIGTDVWNSRIIITSASGIHAIPIGEFIIMLMLMFAKNTPMNFKMMKTHRWQSYETQTLRGKTVGIVGLGHIGREAARLAKTFGMKVIAARRSTRQPGKAKNVDLLLPGAGLKQLLSYSDYVILSVPLTPETHHLIGEPQFKLMKPNARIINIGRGQLIDEQALIRAIEQKRIAGAGLDVTSTEPLAENSRLWDFDNVIISPHVSGEMEDYMLRATEVFCENLRRRLSGKRLINVVDKGRGY